MCVPAGEGRAGCCGQDQCCHAVICSRQLPGRVRGCHQRADQVSSSSSSSPQRAAALGIERPGLSVVHVAFVLPACVVSAAGNRDTCVAVCYAGALRIAFQYAVHAIHDERGEMYWCMAPVDDYVCCCCCCCSIEYNVSYVYHSLFAYFDRDNVGLPGMAKFFKVGSQTVLEQAVTAVIGPVCACSMT